MCRRRSRRSGRNLGASTVDLRGEDYHGEPVGLGFRVPMLIVSPWTRGGWVNSQVFDHTSVLRFLERRFGVAEPNIGPWRRAVCGDLTSAFDFDISEAERRDTRWLRQLPDTSDYRTRSDALAGCPRPLRPAAGRCRARNPGSGPPAPCPTTWRFWRLDDDQLTLRFLNRGRGWRGVHGLSRRRRRRSALLHRRSRQDVVGRLAARWRRQGPGFHSPRSGRFLPEAPRRSDVTSTLKVAARPITDDLGA
jgi:hypothetical protein